MEPEKSKGRVINHRELSEGLDADGFEVEEVRRPASRKGSASQHKEAIRDIEDFFQADVRGSVSIPEGDRKHFPKK